MPPDKFVKPKLWKLNWSDEFNGPVANDPCYTRPPKCVMAVNITPVDCPAHLSKALRFLNKCHWSVYSFYNYGDQGKIPDNPDVAPSEKKGINAYDPSMVTFGDGELILRTQKVNVPDYNCGQNINGKLGTGCPFISGGIESQRFGNLVEGKFFKYGRFEVRAKLPTGRGSWPAHWLLPEATSNPSVVNWWPQAGEIDIMERWANWEESTAHSLHSKTNGTHVSHTVRIVKKGVYAKSFTNEYHIYAVEWDESKLNFYVDNRLVGTIEDNKILSNGLPIRVPKDHAFFWILNNTIAHHCYAESSFQPLPQFCSKALTSLPNSLTLNDIPKDFKMQMHHIDYVRHYVECSSSSKDPKCVESTLSPFCKNPCQGLGQFDGHYCYLGKTKNNNKAKKIKTSFMEESPDGHLSFWGRVPDGRMGFINGNSFYLTPVCSPTNTIPNCANPCPKGGTYDGRNCLIMSVPDNVVPFIHNRGFYYKKTAKQGPNICSFKGPYGVKFDSANCLLNYWAPPGTTPFIYKNNFYLTSACKNTTDWVSIGGHDADLL